MPVSADGSQPVGRGVWRSRSRCRSGRHAREERQCKLLSVMLPPASAPSPAWPARPSVSAFSSFRVPALPWYRPQPAATYPVVRLPGTDPARCTPACLSLQMRFGPRFLPP
eukprot:2111009-Rhodomonas_salina.2